MKQFIAGLLLVSVLSLLTNGIKAQLTGTKNIPGDYATLALAISALNAQGVGVGGVTINLVAGNPQTAPAGGYVIGGSGNILVGATNPTATNPVIIEGNSNTITAFTPQVLFNLNDGIFKLVGADYITLQHFNLTENAANNSWPNMTEWGIALLHASVTDGAQNNTISNNTIQLNRANANTFAIYSNTSHSASSVTVAEDITSVGGSNSGNKVYGNQISNTGYGIVFVGSATAAYMDNANDLGGVSAATGNNITNWGGSSTTISGYIGLTTMNNYCILIYQQINENISYNTISSATVSGATFEFGGIHKSYPSGQPAGTISSTISYNTITLISTNPSGLMIPINNASITAGGAISTVTIDNNIVLNCTYSTGSGFYGLYNTSVCSYLNMTNNTIKGTRTTGTGPFLGIVNTGAVDGTINMNNNQLGDASAGVFTCTVATNTVDCGIGNFGGGPSTILNITNNTIQGFSYVSKGRLSGIYNTANVGEINVNNNHLGTAARNLITFSAANFGDVNGIWITGGTSATNVSIQGNDVRGIVHSIVGSSPHKYIQLIMPIGSANVSNNTFTNLNVNTTGTINFITTSGNMLSTSSLTCSNNSIVTAFNNAAGAVVYIISCHGSCQNGSTITETGNNFSNITVGSYGPLYCIDNEAVATPPIAGPTITITNNTFSNITSWQFNGLIFSSKANTICSSNTISNISTTGGDIWGILYNYDAGVGSHTCTNNTITSLTTSGNIFGISGGVSTIPSWAINGNRISGLSSTGASAAIYGIKVDNGFSINIYDNIISNLTGSGTTSPVIYGIYAITAANIRVFKNRVYNLLQSGSISTTSPAINGILLTSGVAVTVFNNFISDLKATAANLTDAIRGISVTSTDPNATYNLFHNSVYINASSTGTNFGTSGIYHVVNATATTATLNMIDNIIVNTSTPSGTGLTVAYRRSGTALNNYAATSDYNLFYAGTPGANKLIFHDGTNADQTLAAYKTRMSTRDANSISSMPNFTSVTDLHLTTLNCAIENKGTPVAGVTADIDAETRSSTQPDIGADEFTSESGTLAGLSGGHATQQCVNKAVVNTGTTFSTATCNLLLKIVPSGASPVTGNINTCVTIEPLSPFPSFNTEPYVQRYYDIEPATLPASSTATITLYYRDQEFIDFNANNGVWPDLPTAALGNADPNISNVRITQYHGTATAPWGPGNYTPSTAAVLITPAVFWNATVARWELSFNTSGFSGFYVHTNLLRPLAISLNYFKGARQGNNHLLNWEIELNKTANITITLERSKDAIHFDGIHTLTADAIRCGSPFNYTDAAPLEGINYYRLKMVDENGKVSYSGIVALINASQGIELMNIAPNPVTGNICKLNITSAKAEQLELLISDMMGRVLISRTISLLSGFNSTDIPVNELAKGNYSIYGFTAEGRTRVIKFMRE